MENGAPETVSGFEARLGVYEIESNEAANDRNLTEGTIINKYLPRFYDTVEAARLGLGGELVDRRGDTGTLFLAVHLSKSSYPKISAGLVNIGAINKKGLLYRDDSLHFSVPVLEQFRFSMDWSPIEASDGDIAIKVIKRREGFRPRVLMGTQDDMMDLVTRPAYASAESFRSFLARLYSDQLKPEDERMTKLANDLFQYFSFM